MRSKKPISIVTKISLETEFVSAIYAMTIRHVYEWISDLIQTYILSSSVFNNLQEINLLSEEEKRNKRPANSQKIFPDYTTSGLFVRCTRNFDRCLISRLTISLRRRRRPWCISCLWQSQNMSLWIVKLFEKSRVATIHFIKYFFISKKYPLCDFWRKTYASEFLWISTIAQ